MIAGIAERVAGTAFAEWAVGSSWAYPVTNTVHVLALVLLLGGIGLLDLRVLGLFRRLPLQPLSDALIPLAAAGLLILAASGSILFAADATALAGSGTFRLKLTLIAVALANVVLFRWRYGEVMPDRPPIGMRALASTSLLLWTSIAISGRWIAYS
jgi:hypothetical protein